MHTFPIYCVNTKSSLDFLPGTRLLDMLNTHIECKDKKYVAAYVNHQLKSLTFELYEPASIEFITLETADGMRCYQRSLSFILQKAVVDVCPEHKLHIDHSVSKGYFCELDGLDNVPETLCAQIELRMKEIVAEKWPFVKVKIPNNKAIELFEAQNHPNKAQLFKTRKRLFCSIYYLDEYPNYFYGPLLPSTDYIDAFGLIPYFNGMLLMFPTRDNPYILEPIVWQKKMFDIFQEHKHWLKIMHIATLGNVNQAIQENKTGELIKLAEALHEKKYAMVADKIWQQREKVKLVLISGPSSSGKTTTSFRLALQMKVAGMNPVVLAMDNYFLNRAFTPKDEKGNYDFETIHAMDLKQLNEDLTRLLKGEEVEIPRFDFSKGERYFDGTKLQLHENDIFILEGIHALNPLLTQEIANDLKYKVYASALTSVSLDNNNFISTTDNRMLRRIVRDAASRGATAQDTIKRWPSIRQGEDKNIFPYQENADIMLNTSLLYELNVLKHYAEPLLREIPHSDPEYADATRLLKLLTYFENIRPEMEKEIPPTSVLREFIGGSSFRY